MADNTMNYTMDNYGQKSAFASFLPGISGVKGIPIWCYYVNRGQGVVSFGVENKDHAIMEFYPAHQAYQNVKITGFRTFIKKDGNVTEAFRDETVFHSMHIEMNGLNIEEVNKDTGLTTKVSYFTLPGERIGALVRKVTICNTGDSAASIEVLDGMPACIPYGIDLESLKTMGQTMKAWMQVEYTQNKIPFIKARASTVDSAAVTEVTGGNFAIGCLADGSRLHLITDPEVVFAYDLSLDRPVNFKTNSVAELNAMEQVEQNLLPCSFFGTAMELAPGE